MRRLLFALLLLILPSLAFAGYPADGRFIWESRSDETVGTAAAGTNYCADANAQLCLFMNNNGGNETDRTANAYTFTANKASIETSATVPTGYSGTSRNFTKTNTEYLYCEEASCPNLDINGVDAKISLTAWINNASIANTAEHTIVGKYDTTGNQRQYKLGIIGTGTNLFKFRCIMSPDGTAATALLSTTEYASGTYYHAACVSNDTDIRIYVNGSLDSTPAAYTTGIFNGSSLPEVAANGPPVNVYDGLIDEVAVFNRELSATEVSNIYTYGISGNKGGSD